jgi:hypothetical protein
MFALLSTCSLSCSHDRAVRRITGVDRAPPSDGRSEAEEEDDKGIGNMIAVEDFWTKKRRDLLPIIGSTLPFVLGRPAGNIAAESLFSHADLVLSKRRAKLEGGMLSTLVALHYDEYSVVDQFVAREAKEGEE